ncbi:MAG: DUF4136 domain-containing protein [Gammaproteobacteria bacterium]|nr:DUF4136 domain-containing protein [Gammaproteobacteria bacterium]
MLKINHFAIIAFIFLSACQTNRARVDYDVQTDFSLFDSYSWKIPASAPNSQNPLLDERAKQAVTQQLKDAGFIETTTNPDLLVRTDIQSTISSESSNKRGGIGLGGGSGGLGMGISLGIPLGKSKTIRDVSIIVDFLEPQTETLKWRGNNTIKISDESPEEITKLINQSVADIFKKYPPKK